MINYVCINKCRTEPLEVNVNSHVLTKGKKEEIHTINEEDSDRSHCTLAGIHQLQFCTLHPFSCLWKFLYPSSLGRCSGDHTYHHLLRTSFGIRLIFFLLTLVSWILAFENKLKDLSLVMFVALTVQLADWRTKSLCLLMLCVQLGKLGWGCTSTMGLLIIWSLLWYPDSSSVELWGKGSRSHQSLRAGISISKLLLDRILLIKASHKTRSVSKGVEGATSRDREVIQAQSQTGRELWQSNLGNSPISSASVFHDN